VEPGATVLFETLDCNYGSVARNLAELDTQPLAPDLRALVEASAYPEQTDPGRGPELRFGHALTGPVAVAGARPGDTLAVEIVSIEPAAWGWNSCHGDPQRIGLLNDDIGPLERSRYHIWDLREGTHTTFKPGIRVPLAPFCGVMGVAPAEPGQHSTIPPRRNGGNMDLRHLTAGTTLYLPVLARGGLLSIGDVHAAQGDGEVTGTGIEMDATVTLRLNVIKDWAPRQPSLRTAGEPLSIPGPYYVATGHHPDLREAAREALSGALDYLEAERGLTRAEGYLLASVCVDLKISQIVDAPNFTVAAYVPLSIFEG
jgi:acetamidase/formamidase